MAKRIGLVALGGLVAVVVLALGALYLGTPSRGVLQQTPGAATGPLTFPAGFYWGAALAGHQAESQQASDWTAFEDEVLRERRFEAGKAYGTTRPGHIRDFGHWSEAVRRQKSAFDTHYADDLATAAGLGLNAVRISIEWARLFPRAGMTAPAPEAIAYYRDVFAVMKAQRITPFVTLFHYVAPRWFFEPDATGRRGWERGDAQAHWGRFVEAVADAFIPDVEHWCTLNEPMVYLYNGYVDGVYPPLEHRADAAAAADVYAALLEAHALAYRTLHRVADQRHARAVVGITQAAQAFAPLRNWHPADRVIARLVTQAWNWDFLDAIQSGRMRIAASDVDRAIAGLRGTQDYVGINYYTRVFIRGDLAHPTAPEVLYRDPAQPDEPVNDMGWTYYPRGLYAVLTDAARRYARPLYILENGTADHADDDVGRQRYLTAHVREVWHAIHDGGADVRAYIHWSLLDNFEWVDGFGPRLGLIAVDYEDSFRRTPRASAALYAEIARGNALPARFAQP
jgi:beta-glucosidase